MPHARPTTDRAKEALFNILYQTFDFEETKVLDLYGGMGSMALEFSSRGCPEVVTVDFNRKSVQYIKDVATKLEAAVNVKQSKVLPFLKRMGNKYDIIFADPPYNAGPEIQELIETISSGNFLNSEGVFILEHQSMTQVQHPTLIESRSYGQSTFSFFKFEEINE